MAEIIDNQSNPNWFPNEDKYYNEWVNDRDSNALYPTWLREKYPEVAAERAAASTPPAIDYSRNANFESDLKPTFATFKDYQNKKLYGSEAAAAAAAPAPAEAAPALASASLLSEQLNERPLTLDTRNDATAAASSSVVAGMFPEVEAMQRALYQQKQNEAMQAQALQFAKLSPFEKASYGLAMGGQQLGDTIGGALGAKDPQMQMISLQNQMLRMVDPNKPETYDRAISLALQTGDRNTALMLNDEKKNAQVRKTENLQLGLQKLAQTLYKPDGSIDENVYATLQSYGAVGLAIIDQQVKGTQGLESQQVQTLARSLFNADGTRNKEVEQKLSRTIAGRDILAKFAAPTKEIKKGEKLAERQSDGTWKVVPLEGLPTQTTTSDNAIQSLIAGKAIHPTVLPYAQQLARNFGSLDFEDQNILMEKLTKINNDAQKYASEKNAKDQSRETSNSLRDLNIQLAELKIKEAQAKSLKAEDGKEIKFADGTKLANQAAGVDKLVDLLETFKPTYAGYPTDAAGAIAVLVAGKLSDPESVDLYQWWQAYQDHVNKVRNELFGAALTAPEKAEFEKAMVTKGMSPTQAKANLERQANSALKAYNKIENVLRVQGYSKSALDILKPTGIRPPLSSPELQKK